MIGLLINIGFNNLVSAERIVAIISPTSVPARKLKDEAKKSGHLIDVTAGRAARSMIVTSSNHILLSAVESKTLAIRFREAVVAFYERLGNPITDELIEPGQGPDIFGPNHPQGAILSKKPTPRAPVVKHIGVIAPNPKPEDDLDPDPQVAAKPRSVPYGDTRPLKDPDYELKPKDIAFLKADDPDDEDDYFAADDEDEDREDDEDDLGDDEDDDQGDDLGDDD